MRRKLMWALVVGGVTVGAAPYVRTVLATPASGFTSTSLAIGRLGEFDVMHKLVWDDPDPTNSKKNVWHSTQKTKGNSDLYVQSNVWIPGGTSGWHTHPGHSLITVTAGTVTAYEGDDPTCTPKVYTVGMTFVDEGGEHVHVIRNEGAGRGADDYRSVAPGRSDAANRRAGQPRLHVLRLRGSSSGSWPRGSYFRLLNEEAANSVDLFEIGGVPLEVSTAG